MIHQEISRAFVKSISYFNEFIRNELHIPLGLKDNANLFPLIDHMYESDEGKVGELSFLTDEGSIKNEKMRKGKVDLRRELYHKAGKEAVDHISTYRISILWNLTILDDIETYPELLLPGQSHCLNSKPPKLDEVIVKKCSCLEDYNFILNKIIKYLDDCD
jgi:hypothetical protein